MWFGLLRDPRRGNTWSPARRPAAAARRVCFRRQQQRHGGERRLDLAGNKQGQGSADQGSDHWQSAQTPLASGNDSSGVFSLAFRDQKHGIAVGGDYRKPEDATGTAAYTSDGGEHWSVPRKPPHGYRSAVAWDAERSSLDHGGQQWIRYLL